SNVEVINTYDSLLINYVSGIENVYDDFLVLKTYDFNVNFSEALSTRKFRLPVCYDAEFGLDLKEISDRNKLTVAQIIELHTAPDYLLYFLGFLPGFLYLGGMDKKLAIPRKKQPRKMIEKGAVGIAENQTGIYPRSSPAGWQIIGNCPVDLFDPKLEIPSLFLPGDKIQFFAIDKEEYVFIKEQIRQNKYELKPINNG
ncbi:MAG: 5-oxoprolinase subunit PxpB, partial [Leeuwenhoekiella sp.]